jgi:WD40 repeat protein
MAEQTTEQSIPEQTVRSWGMNKENFSRNLAVIIGIDHYEHHPAIRNLTTPVRDAEAIAALLKKDYDYKPENVISITDTDVTFNALINLFETRLPKELKPSADDRLIVYFAGHGLARSKSASSDDYGPEGYLAPHDADPAKEDSFLSMRRVSKALGELKCHHLLVILDCCFAGTFQWAGSRKSVPILEKIRREHYYHFIRHPSWQVITSSAHDQEALDVARLQEDNRQPVSGLGGKHSPFALALLEGLQPGDDPQRVKADLFPDGIVTAHELFVYLQNRVKELSNKQQAPGIYPLRREFDRGEFVFTPPKFDPTKLDEALPLNEDNNPYRGLNSFDEKHAEFFFGRQVLIEELENRLAQPNQALTVVLGVSGSGKSSLVKAGLIPHLRKPKEEQKTKQSAQEWYILNSMRPGELPFISLGRTLLPLVNAGLLEKVAQLSYLDKIFEDKLEARTKANQNTDSEAQGQKAKANEMLIKVADSWCSAKPEAKLLLIEDYFALLETQGNAQEQAQLKTLYNQILAELGSVSESLQKNLQFLSQAISAWSQKHAGVRLLLVIDQFEELLTRSQDDRGSLNQSEVQAENRPDDQKEWQKFLEALRIAIKAHPQTLRLVLTLRSDFEPRFLSSALEKYWKDARFPVRAMTSDELRQAIENPALKQALYFEESKDEKGNLVSKLVDEVGQMPGALPLLSFTLSELYVRLYKRWTDPSYTGRTLLFDDYVELGGVAGGLTRRATEEYDRLLKEPDLNDEYQGGFGKEEGKAYQATLQRVMLRMVAIEGAGMTRRRVSESELVYPSDKENNRVGLILDRLIKSRLIVKGQEIGDPYVEPAHDFLVRGWDKLQEWKDKEQENIVLQQRLTSAATDWYKAAQVEGIDNKVEQVTGLLWKDDPRLEKLKSIIKSETDNWLNQIEKQFFEESVQEQKLELEKTEKQRDEAIQGQIGALASLSQVRMLINDQLGALIASLKAGSKLKDAPWLKDKLGLQVFDALQQCVYAIQERNRFEENIDPIYRITFSHDGQKIATANLDKTVKIWSIDGTLINTFKGHTDEVISVEFSPDGSFLASGSKDKTVKIWTINDSTLFASFQQHKSSVCSVSFSIDGKILASASDDGTINLWNVVDKNFIQALQSYNGAQVCFSPDGKTIASGGWDQPPWQGKIRFWNLDGSLLNTFEVGTGVLRGIDFSNDGKTIACTGDTGVVQLRQVTDGQLIVNIEAHQGGVWAMDTSISPDGSMIASVSNDRTVKLWTIDGSLIKTLLGHTDAVYGVAFSPDSKTLATVSADKTVRLWNVDGPFLKSFDGKPGSAHFCIRYSPDGNMLASGSWDVQERSWTVKLWSTDGELLEILTGYSDSIQTINFSPDGSLIAAASWDGTVGIWTSSGELVRDFDNHGYAVNSASFSFNGKVLATVGGYERNVRLWDLDSGEHLKDIIGHRDQVYRILFNPNGETFATASWDRTVKLWSIDGNLLKTFSGHSNWLYGLSFSPDGKLLVSAGLDRTVKIWNTEGELLKSFVAHQDGIRDVVFSPDGNIIASASLDKTVKLWSLEGTLLKTISGHTAGVYGVTFSKDGQTIATASWDGSIKLWSTEILDFEGLINCGSGWLHDYLNVNPDAL